MAFQRIMLKNVRIAFTNFMFDPKEEATDSYYKVAAIIPQDGDHAKQLGAALNAVAKEQWQDKAAGVLKKLIADRRVCYSSSSPTTEEGEVYNGFDGAGVLNASRSQTRASGEMGVPLIIGGGSDGKHVLKKQDGVIHSGVWGNLSVEIWTQDNKFGKRINADFRGFQFLKADESLGGSGGTATNADEFETLDRADAMAEALEPTVPATEEDDLPPF